jgi:1-acyl-sn-glycerol-3-phosphate acyltransferase
MTTPAADVERTRSEFMVQFFGRVLARQMQRSFDAVRLLRPGVPMLAADRPVVLYCNHPSWWDAAFLAVIATRLFPSRRAYGPIDAAALARYRFMGRIGFFGIEPGSVGALTWLRTGRALLARPDTLLIVTPEGSFTDPRVRPLVLRPGLAALLARAPHAQVLPVALDYPFWTERTPEALAAFGTPFSTRGVTRPLQQLLAERLTMALDTLAEAACRKEAERFSTLLSGRSGVGGMYDLWRRTQARLRGEHFDAAHRAVRSQAQR